MNKRYAALSLDTEVHPSKNIRVLSPGGIEYTKDRDELLEELSLVLKYGFELPMRPSTSASCRRSMTSIGKRKKHVGRKRELQPLHVINEEQEIENSLEKKPKRRLWTFDQDDPSKLGRKLNPVEKLLRQNTTSTANIAAHNKKFDAIGSTSALFLREDEDEAYSMEKECSVHYGKTIDSMDKEECVNNGTKPAISNSSTESQSSEQAEQVCNVTHNATGKSIFGILTNESWDPRALNYSVSITNATPNDESLMKSSFENGTTVLQEKNNSTKSREESHLHANDEQKQIIDEHVQKPSDNDTINIETLDEDEKEIERAVQEAKRLLGNERTKCEEERIVEMKKKVKLPKIKKTSPSPSPTPSVQRISRQKLQPVKEEIEDDDDDNESVTSESSNISFDDTYLSPEERQVKQSLGSFESSIDSFGDQLNQLIKSAKELVWHQKLERLHDLTLIQKNRKELLEVQVNDMRLHFKSWIVETLIQCETSMKEFETTQLPTDKKLFADTILRYDEAIRRMDKAIKSLRREFKKAEKIVSNQGRELVNMNSTKPQIKRFRELVDVKSYEPQLEGLRVAWNRMKQKVEDAKNNIVRIGMWNSSRKL